MRSLFSVVHVNSDSNIPKAVGELGSYSCSIQFEFQNLLILRLQRTQHFQPLSKAKHPNLGPERATHSLPTSKSTAYVSTTESSLIIQYK
jgi:hypothetical protein